MADDPSIQDLAKNLAMSEPLMVLGNLAAQGGQKVQDAYDTLKQHLSDLAGSAERAATSAGSTISSAASKVSQAIVPKLKAEEQQPAGLPPIGAEVLPAIGAEVPTQGAAQPMNFAKVNGQNVPVDSEPNTLGTFLSHAGAQVNPVPVGQMIPFPHAMGGAGWDAPVTAAKGMLAAQGVPLDNAIAAYKSGNTGQAAVHLLNYFLPIIGPILDKSGNELQKGQYAAGLGDAMGLAGAIVGPKVAGQVSSAALASRPAQAIADTADAAASRRITDVIKPTVGANKVRFANMATDVAPAVARETTGLTRSALADSIAGKLEESTSGLDEAANQRLGARSVPTQPIIDSLMSARRRLTAEAVDASKVPGTKTNLNSSGQETVLTKTTAEPLGKDVVPTPNTGRVAQIDQAIKEIKQLGPVARYEPLRRIREAYDHVARVKYSPSMTADFLAKQGEASGAADVTNSLRDFLAKLDPATVKANADYSLWKKASDVVTAAEETDRARPTVGRTIMARGLGAAAGAAEGGGVGAIVGAVLGPMLERGAMSLAPAMKITVARQLASLADAIRAGQSTRATALLQSIRQLVPASAAMRGMVPTVAGAAAQSESPASPAVGAAAP